MAKNFQFFVLNGLTLTYRPRVATQHSGAVYMAFEPNVDDALPSSLEEFNQIDGAKSMSIWDKGLSLHVSRKDLMQGMSRRFIRSDSQDVSDLDKYDAGRLLYGSSGYVGVLGEIWLKLSLVCTVPQPLLATIPQNKNNVSHYRNVEGIPVTGPSPNYTPLKFEEKLQGEAEGLISNTLGKWAETADDISILKVKEDVRAEATVEVPVEVQSTGDTQFYLDAWLSPESGFPQLIQTLLFEQTTVDPEKSAGFMSVAIPLALLAGQTFGFTLRSTAGSFTTQNYSMRLLLAVARLVAKSKTKFTSLTATPMATVARSRGLPWPPYGEDKSPRAASAPALSKDDSKVSTKIRQLQRELGSPPPLSRK